MLIEYRPKTIGEAEINVWVAFEPPTHQYLYIGSSYSVMMVPGFEDFWS